MTDVLAAPDPIVAQAALERAQAVDRQRRAEQLQQARYQAILDEVRVLRDRILPVALTEHQRNVVHDALFMLARDFRAVRPEGLG